MFCISCAFTSIFSGFVMFSIVGFMAHDSNTSVEKVVDAGKYYPDELVCIVDNGNTGKCKFCKLKRHWTLIIVKSQLVYPNIRIPT